MTSSEKQNEGVAYGNKNITWEGRSDYGTLFYTGQVDLLKQDPETGQAIQPLGPNHAGLCAAIFPVMEKHLE